MDTELPVISITTDPKNLWDDNIGIYTKGTNGISFWSVKANYWQEWERPAKVEFFEDDKTIAFELNAGISINGARRNMLQKSLRIFARDKYGAPSINYKIFPDKEIRNFTSLVLRNGGYPEFISTLFRDGFIQTLISNEMDIDYQAYRPSILYLNGKYWGIYNIREKQNEEYLKENNGVDPDNLDILENNMVVVEGDSNHYQNMIDFISANDLSIQENYDSVKNFMEIDNFINYQIAQLYIANADWPGNNIKFWRPKTNDGKWRWLIFDLDGGFGLWHNYDFNSIEFATEENSSEWNNAPWSTFLFRNLLKNQEFADEFVQRFAAYLSYSFNREDVIELMTSFQNRIEKEIPNHINRWAPNCSITNPESKDGCMFEDISTWYENINIVKEFAVKRPNYVMEHLMNYFSISDTIKVLVSSNSTEGGNVFVNEVNSKFGVEAKLFSEKKITFLAKPKAGYRFVGWKGDITAKIPTLEILRQDDFSIEAVFQPINNSVVPSIINSDLVLTAGNSPYYTEDDIYIYEDATLTIEPGVELNLSAEKSIYVYGNIEMFGIEEDPILIKSSVTGINWGSINFVNAKKKSKIFHTKISGTSNGKDKIDQIGGISSFNSDLELNYVEMDNVQFPIFIQYGNFVMRNSKIHTEVTSDFVNVKYGKAVIENCEFIGNLAPDTDAIDYDDVNAGIIRRNKIHSFYGDNSDAIDIGEGAKDILIEENLIYNCSDKGVSIGQESTAIIKGNVIANCNLGVGIKDDKSYGFIDHNTFYNNNIAVSCFEKNIGRGGGKADITNSILSNSTESDIFADQFSEINISYSLSDKNNIEGVGNLFGEPNFLNPDSLDFRISESSLAFNSGDPNYKLDADGSRTNMGASFYNFVNFNKIVITEINYHSSVNFNTKDWIEFYNPNKNSVDLSGWIFKDSEDAHIYTFPSNAILGAEKYLILSEDITEFKTFYPTTKNVIGNFDFGLNNSGETVRLFDNYGNIIDSLTYDDKDPWPIDADGNGYTLQLINHELDNSLAENWASPIIYGTPGNLNIVSDIENDEVKIPKEYSLSQNYPNPFNPSTSIKFEIPKNANVTLKVFDVLGRELRTIVDKNMKAGSYIFQFNAIYLSSGIYFYQLIANDFHKTYKMILLK
ncbi:MAG: CotH kinase family protein [Ignavibacteriales bacterium]|nr:CotH kinase family protein [Ignavibacteriales bacterium]